MCVNMVHECVILCVCCVYQWEVMGHQEVYGWSLRSSGPPTSTGQGPEHTWEAKATQDEDKDTFWEQGCGRIRG